MKLVCSPENNEVPDPDPTATRGWRIDEAARAAAITKHDVESLRDAANLQGITDFAAALCDAPIAMVSLVEERRQTFLARTGIGRERNTA